MLSSRLLRALPRLQAPSLASAAVTATPTRFFKPLPAFRSSLRAPLVFSRVSRSFAAFPNHVLPPSSTPTLPLDIPRSLSQADLEALPSSYHQYVSGYGYFPVSDPSASAKALHEALTAEGYTGRIYISEEGINVQATCHPSKATRLIEIIRSAADGQFATMRLFKNEIFESGGQSTPFSRLVCKPRPLINEGLQPEFSKKISEHLDGYVHLPPAQWHEEMLRIHKAKALARAKQGQGQGQGLGHTAGSDAAAAAAAAAEVDDKDANALIFDVRNIYEFEIGSFAHAKPISADSFSSTYPDLDRLLGLSGPATASAHLDTVEGEDPVLLAAKHTRSRRFSTARDGTQVDAAEARQIFDATVLPTVDWDAVIVSASDSETLLARSRARAAAGDSAAAAADAAAAAAAAAAEGGSDRGDGSEGGHLAPIVPTPVAPVAKDTKIRMFCTGGIRCVKVGAYLAQQGFTDVAVLEGGVNAYAGYVRDLATTSSATPTAATAAAAGTGPGNAPTVAASEASIAVDPAVAPRVPTGSPAIAAASLTSTFIGANAVFDERRSVRVTDHEVGRCHTCGAPCSLPNNCVQPRCNTLMLRCSRCTKAYGGACSALCAFEFDKGVNVVPGIIAENQAASAAAAAATAPTANAAVDIAGRTVAAASASAGVGEEYVSAAEREAREAAKYPITLRLYGPQTTRHRPRIAPMARPLDFA